MKFNSFINRVVVITGASSGVGKLAVEKFLAQGAKVVLAARSENDMRLHLQELRVGEEAALVVKTDVSDYNQVVTLAQTAIQHFGKIDVWINNAASNLYGYMEDADPADMRRVIEVDLMGAIYGMKVILPYFVAQGFGNIINIGSVDGAVSLPLQAAYDAAKHGLLGFSSALREELLTERYRNQKIDVVDILPASLDTPLYLHAKTTTNTMYKPVPPIYDPVIVVKAMIKHAKQPKPVVIVGQVGKAVIANARFMPVVTERMLSRFGQLRPYATRAEAVDGSDNLYTPMPGTNTVRGGFGTSGEELRHYFRHHPWRVSMLGLLPLLLTLTWLSRKTWQPKTV